MRIRPYRTVNNVIDGVIITFEDITKLKQTEEALRDSEKSLSLAFQATNDAVWDYDLVNNAIWWNEAYNKLLESRPKSTNNSLQWWIDHIHPDERSKVIASMHASINGPDNFWQASYRFLRDNGECIHLFDRAYIVRDHNGKATRIIGAILNVTQQKETLESLHQQNRLLNNIFNAIPFMLALKDQKLVYKTVNQAFCHFIGMSVF